MAQPPTDPIHSSEPDAESVRAALEKLRSSDTFRSIPHYIDRLQFLIEEKLAGRQDQLTASVIAVELFKGKENRNVRADLGRLRDKLTAYYGSEGKSDAIRIDIPSPGYVPIFSAHVQFSREEGVYELLTADHVITRASAEKRWDEVIRKVDRCLAILETFPQPLRPDVQLAVATFKITRLQAMVASKLELGKNASRAEFVDIQKDLRSLDIKSSPPSLFTKLLFCSVVHDLCGDTAEGQELRAKLLELVPIEGEEGPALAQASIVFARGLAMGCNVGPPLHQAALTLIDQVIAKISSCETETFSEILAKALVRRIQYLIALERPEESLASYSAMNLRFESSVNPQIVSDLAWASTEATRALRGLGQDEAADVLAQSMKGRFGSVTAAEAIDALAWATVELCKTSYKAKKFEESARVVSAFIAEVEPSARERNLEWPLAWAYAHKAVSLRRARFFSEALATCETALSRFGDSEDADIRTEVAFLLVEKATTLCRLKRLSASAEAARFAVATFKSSDDDRIKREVAWAIGCEGKAVLCEGKLLKQAGMPEDAQVKLLSALQSFEEAARMNPTLADYQEFIAYIKHLLGDRTAAESAFRRSVELTEASLAKFESGDFPEMFDMFSLPEDLQFRRDVEAWAKT